MANENSGQDPVENGQPLEPGGQEVGQGSAQNVADELEMWKREARKWEARAKENRNAAQKNEDSATKLKLATERAEKAEAELADTKARQAHAELQSLVSEKTGVPASLLHGETEEELTASAQAISEFVKASAPAYPTDKGGAPTPQAATRESISQIKDPLERIAARAENVNLYQ